MKKFVVLIEKMFKCFFCICNSRVKYEMTYYEFYEAKYNMKYPSCSSFWNTWETTKYRRISWSIFYRHCLWKQLLLKQCKVSKNFLKILIIYKYNVFREVLIFDKFRKKNSQGTKHQWSNTLLFLQCHSQNQIVN